MARMHRFLRLLRVAAPTLIGAQAAVADDTAFDAPGNGNPIVPGYFADPTIREFDGVFYLYATTDGNGGGRGPPVAWVSKDFAHWVLVPMNWPRTPHYWAPDVVRRPDGRYYLYFNQPCNTYGGGSESPVGPWTPLTPGDGLVIRDRLVKDVITLDTQLFEDRDGTLYGYWGTWGIFPNSGCGFGVFNADMKSFSRLGMIPNTQAKDFFEAPFMIERNGVYYLTYSSGSCHDASYRVQYAVGRRPDGEFAMGPNNPILASTPDGRVHGPGHHSLLRRGDDCYIVYHRHDLPVTPNGMHRQTCADRLVFDGDGAIRKVEPTHRGIGLLGPAGRGDNLARGMPVTASSHYRDTVRNHEYKPAFAVDDNNATLWRPADNRMGHWLQVDLGRPRRIRRVETQFEYGTWYYRYLIEHSSDGRAWTTFADRRGNTRWGSPMVDDGDAEARHLRITVTGVEFPGLFGAIWNLKVFADAAPDSLLAMADRAFARFIAPTLENSIRDAPAVQSAIASRPSSIPPTPLIHLASAALPLGAPVSVWTNEGALGGEFRSGDTVPSVGMAEGCKAVRFAGRSVLTASFPAPRSLAGNSRFTVAAWVNNPELAESECLVSWAGRGGPDATTAQVGYGTHPEFGAVGHWGFADMGFGGPPPEAGRWRHLAVVFDGVIERLYVDGRMVNAEPKMLMLHEGRPVYVGASEPGTEHLDGWLASLSVYNEALDEAHVAKLAAEPPAADVLAHVDSATLDCGPLKEWRNGGALGGAFVAADGAPRVRDVAGRIAAVFGDGTAMALTPAGPVPLGDFTLLASVANPTLEPGECAVEAEETDGRCVGLVVAPAAGAWRQTAFVSRGGAASVYVDGQPAALPAPRPPASLKSLRLGGQPSFSGALARVQLFRRALSDTEIAGLFDLWTKECQRPSPDPAAFERPPAAISPNAVAMTAHPGRSAAGSVEYRFTETLGGTGSGWIRAPHFLHDGLAPGARCAYTVAMRDPLGNVTAASPAAEAVTDPALFDVKADGFDREHDFVAAGANGTAWDGRVDAVDKGRHEAVAARGGVLRLQSRRTVWDGGPSVGPFLYATVAGDFVAQVRVTDYAGLSSRRVPGNNDGGLMVRVAARGDAGPGEDLVQLNFFPIWNQGNMVTSLDGGARPQKGNGRAWDAHRHLQIIRQGDLFHFRTSADGERWTAMPGSPVERKDMAGLPLQVGLYHASYGDEGSFIEFDDFRLIRRKGEAPHP